MKSMQCGSVFILTITSIFLLLAASGCGKATAPESAAATAEKTVEKDFASEGKNADVTINPETQSVSMTVEDDQAGKKTMEMHIGDEDSSMVITGEDGTVSMTTGASAGIPEGFPKDVPIHPGMKINMSLNDGGSGFTVQASSDEKFDAIVQFYKAESVKLGWTEQMNMQQNMETPMQMLMYKKDERMLNLVIQTEGESVNITISVAKE